jgi:DNA-binding NtrC family response regulator
VRCLADARTALQHQIYPLVLCDIRLPDGDGETLFDLMRQRYGACCPPVIFMTGFGSVNQAVRLVREGAWDYIQKPFDVDVLMQRIHTWMSVSSDPSQENAWFGISDAARALEKLVAQVVSMDLPVLIQGESGTGKEVVAQRVYELMQATAKSMPFVAINCAALSESLLESELFGHEPGAFTGASKRHIGVFEQANGGVLLLDEIGDMPLAVQVKLLRVLQDGQVRRVGSEKPVQVHVRLICATHKSLDKLVDAGAFRQDLYFRVSGIPIYLSPLRERTEDIAWLAQLRVDMLNEQLGQSKRLSVEFVAWAKVQPWEGNARQLFATIDRAYHFARDCWVRWEQAELPHPGSAPDLSDAPYAEHELLEQYLTRIERKYVEKCLIANAGKITKTANDLGISRKTLWEKLKRYKNEVASIGERM